MKNINLNLYFQKIQITPFSLSNLSIEEKIACLKKTYFAHVKSFPYSNFELRKIAGQHPVQRNTLSFFSYKNLLSDEHGGYCYQSAALLAEALKQLGYETEFCAARVLMGAAINAPEVLELPQTHLVLVVTIEDFKFLLDPGLGSSAPRFPILITGEDELITQDFETFQFYSRENIYVLERKTSQGWLRLMQTDLIPISQKTAEMNLLKLQCCPKTIPIRDAKTVIGVITENGRKSLIWEMKTQQLKFSKSEKGNAIEKILDNFEEGCQMLSQEFDIHHVSAEELMYYCTNTVLPKPIKPWRINFPLDQAELRDLEENLTYKL